MDPTINHSQKYRHPSPGVEIPDEGRCKDGVSGSQRGNNGRQNGLKRFTRETDSSNREEVFSKQDVDDFLRSELADLGRVQGTSTVAVHKITMKDDQTVKQRNYPKNPKMQVEINANVDELLKKKNAQSRQEPVQLTNSDGEKEDGSLEIVCDFPPSKCKVSKGRISNSDYKLHYGLIKGGKVHT